MANIEQLNILKMGVAAWNEWRRKNSLTRPELIEANLSDAPLAGALLSGADLSGADLSGASLMNANLIDANLSEADLRTTVLLDADLCGADLNGAKLMAANLASADLRGANLTGANLSGANLSEAVLAGANLNKCVLASTTFGNNDLSEVKGLEEVEHRAPSTIGIDTLYQSRGRIPEEFLRGAGVPDHFITYLPSLTGDENPIHYYSAFISFSSKDEELAKRLHSRLRQEHVRVYFAPEHMKGGRKVHEQIDEAIPVYDKLLLVLSEHSINSEWVMREIRRARKAERDEKQRKLFPIRLCEFEQLQDWECSDSMSGIDLAEEVRQYFIPDFSKWKDHDAFETCFKRLLTDLQADEGKTGGKGSKLD